MLNAVLMDDQRAKKKAGFSCQFGYQLADGTAQKLRNLAPVHSVRDRGVGGSNPLAPTKILVKPAEMQAFLLGSLRRLVWLSTRFHPSDHLLRIAPGAVIHAEVFEN